MRNVETAVNAGEGQTWDTAQADPQETMLGTEPQLCG